MDKIFFITNYSYKVGFGHLNRCLNIAEYLSNFKKKYFINTVKNNKKIKLSFEIKNLKFLNKNLKKKNLLIFDLVQSEFKKKIIQNILNYSKKNISIVIDNHFNQKINCNYRIFPYLSLSSKVKKIYSGEDYFVFSKKILNISKKNLKKKNQIIISCGGSDTNGLTYKILKKIYNYSGNTYSIKVIIGPLFSKKNITKIKVLSKKFSKTTIFKNPKNFYRMVSESKIAIINSGNTKYECAILGTPFVLLANKSSDKNSCLDFSKKFKVLNKNFVYNKINIINILIKYLNDLKKINSIAKYNRNVFSKKINRTIKLIKNEIE